MEFSAEFVQVPAVRNFELRENRRSEGRTWALCFPYRLVFRPVLILNFVILLLY
jgi:hypothetical protein